MVNLHLFMLHYWIYFWQETSIFDQALIRIEFFIKRLQNQWLKSFCTDWLLVFTIQTLFCMYSHTTGSENLKIRSHMCCLPHHIYLVMHNQCRKFLQGITTPGKLEKNCLFMKGIVNQYIYIYSYRYISIYLTKSKLNVS